MAATPFDPSRPAASVFDIYTDATATARNAPGWPCGGCNFVDLTPGASGARCGCRRFWARPAPGSPVPDQAGWCMCSHHACYHDDGSHDGHAPELHAAGQENERPRTGREPLSPVLGVPLKAPPAVPGMDFSSLGGDGPLSFVHDLPQENDRRSRANASQPPGSMPDTLAWGDFIQSPTPASAHALPPIPAQCLMPSQPASSTSSFQARYLRPFGGKGLQTLNGAYGTRPPPPSQQREDTHAATQQAAAPRPDGFFVLVGPDEQASAASRPGTATQPEPRTAALGAMAQGAFEDLTNTVGDHGHRLDRLETASFHDEYHDRLEHVDVRISELETRVDEVEKLANDNASVANARGTRDDDAATHSLVSASISVASHTAYSQDMVSQVHSLRAQVTQLQSYLPSLNHAWDVEVVFLPFPLKRLWQELHQFKPDSALGSDDWTQLPMTHSLASRRSQSPFCGGWATVGADAEWLLPRACGNTGIIDRRLRSRGLIRTVSVRGPDYRSVQAAVHAAFGAVFREMRILPRAPSSDARSAQFLGLQHNWVPLRKIHKDSRLRFLSPAEMVTPGLWNVPFLNSVMMRSAEPRLFITHPDAYLQDLRAYETGWTWQGVREMTRVYPDVTESREVPEADALEAYWAWSEQLDEAPSAHTSKGLPHEGQRVCLVPSHSAQSCRRSASPVVVRGPSPLLSRRRSSMTTPRVHDASVPMVAPARHSSPAAARLRVVSLGQSRRPSPSLRVATQARVLKRRRTRSPSHQRFTPRWTTSPSPVPLAFSDRHAARGTTPFAYATPYSNAPLQEMRTVRGSSVARTVAEYGPESGYELPGIDSESGSDESYVDGDDDDDDDASATSDEEVTHAQRNPLRESEQWQLPEDKPWPGIEDQDHMSDGENMDPREQNGGQSETSSQPSEYPSTNRAWPDDGETGFHIHEDAEL